VLAENPHQANTRHPAEDWAQALTNAAKNAEPFDTPPPEGVNTLVLLPGDPNEEAWFEAALGPPDLRTDELWAWTVSKM
jgi:hypothetical protein